MTRTGWIRKFDAKDFSSEVIYIKLKIRVLRKENESRHTLSNRHDARVNCQHSGLQRARITSANFSFSRWVHSESLRKSYDFFVIDFSSHTAFSSLYRFFFFSTLIAFPIVIIYRLFLHNNSNITPRRAHAVFIVSGFTICLFNYGWEGESI